MTKAEREIIINNIGDFVNAIDETAFSEIFRLARLAAMANKFGEDGLFDDIYKEYLFRLKDFRVTTDCDVANELYNELQSDNYNWILEEN